MPMDDIKILSPREVAKIMGKSISWVYDHADELGAVRIGGSLIFTESRLKGVFDNAVSGEKWEVAGRYQDRQKTISTELRHQKRGKKVGSRGKSQAEIYGTDPRSHGIANLMFQLLGSC